MSHGLGESHFPSLTPGILPGTRGVRLDWQLHNVFHQNLMATHSCLENPMDRGAWRATVQGLQRVGHN